VQIVNPSRKLSALRYAIIEALRSERRREQFVIAYRNEQLLREFIAAPCIIATGFSSRDEAAAHVRAHILAVAA